MRQPLQMFEIRGEKADALAGYEDVFMDELNVKSVLFNTKATVADERKAVEGELNFDITPELKREGLMREVIRHVQSARKKAGLNVDDRINLSLAIDDGELSNAVDEHKDTIAAETLAESFNRGWYESFETEVKVECQLMKISLEKAS